MRVAGGNGGTAAVKAADNGETERRKWREGEWRRERRLVGTVAEVGSAAAAGAAAATDVGGEKTKKMKLGRGRSALRRNALRVLGLSHILNRRARATCASASLDETWDLRVRVQHA